MTRDIGAGHCAYRMMLVEAGQQLVNANDRSDFSRLHATIADTACDQLLAARRRRDVKPTNNASERTHRLPLNKE